MTNQNNPGQQNQNPGQKPGQQQQGGGQKPGQQQQDPGREKPNPNRQGQQIPIRIASRIVRVSKEGPAERRGFSFGRRAAAHPR